MSFRGSLGFYLRAVTAFPDGLANSSGCRLWHTAAAGAVSLPPRVILWPWSPVFPETFTDRVMAGFRTD
jgi:hypothetical protein